MGVRCQGASSGRGDISRTVPHEIRAVCGSVDPPEGRVAGGEVEFGIPLRFSWAKIHSGDNSALSQIVGFIDVSILHRLDLRQWAVATGMTGEADTRWPSHVNHHQPLLVAHSFSRIELDVLETRM